MTTTRHIPDKAPSTLSLYAKRLNKKLPPKAYFLFVLVMLLLSALAATDFTKRPALLTEGDVAPSDIIADSTFLFRDKHSTQARQNLARRMQPLALDQVTQPIDILHERIQGVFLSVNNAHSVEQREAVRKDLSLLCADEVPHAFVTLLSAPVVQKAVLGSILPQVEQRLREGVVPDSGLARDFPGGVLVRNIVTGEESLQPDSFSLPDLKSMKLLVSQLTKELAISVQAKQAIATLFESLIRPTLVPNYEVTRARADAAAEAVEPVVHRVLKGELIVQQGDRITREQQLKMQVFLQRKGDLFQPKIFLGISVCALLISMGLLFSPSGRPGTAMTNKDFIFLSVLVALFALISKGLAIHGAQIAFVSPRFLPESLAYAVPVAGAAALSAQVFSARRYLVTGLLLAFFCSLMMSGGLALFLFYFLSAMWSTWLTSRNTSRQDVVWSLLPLTAGLFALWAGATLMQDGAHNRYFSEIVAVAGGGLLSMILTFALAPVVEMAFGYTTRFRLMELLNLEQPLLRDLMLTAPGTYHHSLIVSNMCEAGAKRVGAHGMLCKVAALYHDIGKLTKANYFIENQSPDNNPHDRLAPSMSALILISHVKQGVELAKQHRLGQEVTDIIRQHHGTSTIQYFYRKALSQTDAPPPNMEDFRYPGPRPQSREAALVMLADIVEASSRTLDDPTPTRLRNHIDSIIKNIYSAGQLDECELTFRDLDQVADSFHQVLRGLYHHRISYPGAPQGKDDKAKSAKAPAPPSQSQGTQAPGSPAPAYGGVPGERPANAPPAEGGAKPALTRPENKAPRAEVPPIQQ